jgi:hypothetical protein
MGIVSLMTGLRSSVNTFARLRTDAEPICESGPVDRRNFSIPKGSQVMLQATGREKNTRCDEPFRIEAKIEYRPDPAQESSKETPPV